LEQNAAAGGAMPEPQLEQNLAPATFAAPHAAQATEPAAAAWAGAA
jgi:hypothetical protein